jgi:hypothetical protein
LIDGYLKSINLNTEKYEPMTFNFGKTHISLTDETIMGLFAVFACTVGLEGGANIGYVGGLIKSSVMGFKAADFIAQNTHKNNL